MSCAHGRRGRGVNGARYYFTISEMKAARVASRQRERALVSKRYDCSVWVVWVSAQCATYVTVCVACGGGPHRKKKRRALSLSLSLSQAPPPGACALTGAVARKVPLGRSPTATRAPHSTPARTCRSRHEALGTRAMMVGILGGARSGAVGRVGGGVHGLTGSPLAPPQTMRPSGHASTCLVTRHTCQHYELSTRA